MITAGRIIPIFVLAALLVNVAKAQQPTNDAGLKKYGNVVFADTLHHKYPLDTDKHIRIAWAFIHEKSHARKYTRKEREAMMLRIRAAARAHGIQFKS
jgi:rhamnose utilization protein RhaD (predicted bifunctional aldolase and dehydrogenase)